MNDAIDLSTLSNFQTVCEQAIRVGGEVLIDKLGKVKAREKAVADLVTEADLASQEVVTQILLKAFPEHQILGEEGEVVQEKKGASSAFRWIIDPLDGTTNFVHGVPHFCVSLALEYQGKSIVGGVFDPIAEECFMARKNGGAFLNEKPIHTSGITSLSESLAAVGFPPGVTLDSKDLAVFLAALPRCQAIRRTGSAALNLCYLAAGRFDLAWSYSTKIWDMAAGVLIIDEAGGKVTSPSGGPLVLDSGHFLAAASEPLHQALLTLVRQKGILYQ